MSVGLYYDNILTIKTVKVLLINEKYRLRSFTKVYILNLLILFEILCMNGRIHLIYLN